MLNFVNITGKKEVKGFNEEVVIVCPTPGEFRLTPLVQKLLDVKDGDNGLTLLHPEDASRVFLAKGIAGTPIIDADGNVLKDNRGRNKFVEGTEFGAILRNPEGTPMLKLTAAAAWQAIGGDKMKNKVFSLAEPITGTVPTGQKDSQGNDILHTTEFFELIFKSETDKAVRKAKADGEVADEVEEGYEEEAYETEEI
jgi:hypothetical protein